MALNFPNSPTVGQIYTDSTSGFSYEWDGTVWKSFTGASSSNIKIIDDISASFNGSTQTFALTSNGSAISPPTSQSVIVNLGGVIQDPSDDYTISGSNITFTTAPAAGLTFSAVSLGPAVPVDYANDGNVYTRSTFIATAGQTNFTVTGTYTVGYLEVYRNGVRLASGTDFTATNGTTFVLTNPANLNDEIESIAYNVASLVTTAGQLDNLIVSGISTLVGQTNASNINATGIVTASSFVGNVTGTATGLSGTPNLNVGVVTATSFVGSLTGTATTALNFTGTASTASFATTSFGLSGSPAILVSSIGINTTTTNNTKLYLQGNAAGNVVGLGSTTATTTLDFSQGNNFSLTLGATITLANPTGVTTGQSGIILIQEDGTGGYTCSWGSSWDFASSTAPTLTTTANALNALPYFARSTTSIIVGSVISGIGTL